MQYKLRSKLGLISVPFKLAMGPEGPMAVVDFFSLRTAQSPWQLPKIKSLWELLRKRSLPAESPVHQGINAQIGSSTILYA